MELSIVLVILGLLTGGILGGQALMRAAELRKVSQDFGRHQVAINTFQDKYFAMPGDMKTATTFWPSAVGNGNGNGVVQESLTEPAYAWQHLALAGMVAGSYDGIMSVGGDLRPGENVPPAIGTSVWNYMAECDGPIYDVPACSRNTIRVQKTGANQPFTPQEAWGVDVKMDDGIASSGLVIGVNGGVVASGSQWIYDLSNDSRVTAIWFYLE